jgi:hypothetical protein
MHKKHGRPESHKFATEKLVRRGFAYIFAHGKEFPTRRNFLRATIGKFVMCYIGLKGQYKEVGEAANGFTG